MCISPKWLLSVHFLLETHKNVSLGHSSCPLSHTRHLSSPLPSPSAIPAPRHKEMPSHRSGQLGLEIRELNVKKKKKKEESEWRPKGSIFPFHFQSRRGKGCFMKARLARIQGWAGLSVEGAGLEGGSTGSQINLVRRPIAQLKSLQNLSLKTNVLIWGY